METLVIHVADRRKARDMVKELSQRPDVVDVSIQKSPAALPDKTSFRPGVDEITVASEASLGEAWNSPEDDHWDDVYRELCTKKAM